MDSFPKFSRRNGHREKKAIGRGTPTLSVFQYIHLEELRDRLRLRRVMGNHIDRIKAAGEAGGGRRVTRQALTLVHLLAMNAPECDAIDRLMKYRDEDEVTPSLRECAGQFLELNYYKD